MAMTMTKLKHVILKAFYKRREDEKLESKVELYELLVLVIKADRRGGICVGRFKSEVRA